LAGENVQERFGIELGIRQDGAFDIKPRYGGGLFTYSRSMKGNLYYTYFTPKKEILEVCLPIIVTMLMLAGFVFFILLALAWYLSKRFTSPLNKLEEIMIQSEQGDLSVRMNPRYDDEIGRLGRHFDRMIEKLVLLMENNKKIEEEKRRDELRILQLQINPHFLYNTFSSIIWLANERQIDEVIDITKSLSLYYRIALSSGYEWISVGDEVLHVRNYINIQQYRYQDEFKFEWELQEGMENYTILKLVLQPLVENAIYHGAKTLSDGSAVIGLRGYLLEDVMIFEISDNGQEMSEEKAEDLNRDLSQNERRGIGTSNVNNRIRLHYGDSYGLRFLRKNGRTIARITIPLKVRE
jgi:two-component system sensor histidine kinase YesM